MRIGGEGSEDRLEAQEQRGDRMVADAFVAACVAGDVTAFSAAVEALNASSKGWQYAFRGLSKLSAVSPLIKDAFLSVWLMEKEWSRKANDRHAAAAALRLLLPGYRGQAMELYRGTTKRAVQRTVQGLFWTKSVEVARQTAMRWQEVYGSLRRQGYRITAVDDGVVLRATAPPEAILLVRETKDPDENEVVVDPYRIGAVTVVERFRVRQATEGYIPPTKFRAR